MWSGGACWANSVEVDDGQIPCLFNETMVFWFDEGFLHNNIKFHNEQILWIFIESAAFGLVDWVSAQLHELYIPVVFVGWFWSNFIRWCILQKIPSSSMIVSLRASFRISEFWLVDEFRRNLLGICRSIFVKFGQEAHFRETPVKFDDRCRFHGL